MTGAQFEISIDGVPRTYRDRQDMALQTARLLKSRNPHSVVKLKDLKTGEELVVAFQPGRLTGWNRREHEFFSRERSGQLHLTARPHDAFLRDTDQVIVSDEKSYDRASNEFARCLVRTARDVITIRL
jgi:hypothetical protein